MKIWLLSTALLLNAASLFAQNNTDAQFYLNGNVIGQDTGYVRIGYVNNEMKYVNDTCYLKKGDFQFKGFINRPTLLSFSGNTKSRSVNDPNWTEMFIEPGNMQILVKEGAFKKAQVSGSVAQNEFARYQKGIDSLEYQWQNVFDALKKARAENNKEVIDKIYSEQLPIYRKLSHSVTMEYITAFPQSIISAYLLSIQNYLSLDSLKHYYALLHPSVQHSYYGNEIDRSIVKQESLQFGKPAPDFIQTDVNGNQVSLKNFMGKYILLEFWASWCVPCREENPNLKAAYANYHDKGFEIIGFSMDNLEYKDAWKEAIKKDDLPWIQLCDFKVWNSEVLDKYNYLGGQGIPSNFLIDREGKIIAKNLRGEDLNKRLSELMK